VRAAQPSAFDLRQPLVVDSVREVTNDKDQDRDCRANGNGMRTFSRADVHLLFEDGLREVEIVRYGRVREASRNGNSDDERR